MNSELKRKLLRMKMHPDLIKEATDPGLREIDGEVAMLDPVKANRFVHRRLVWCLNHEGKLWDNLDKAFPEPRNVGDRRATFLRERAKDMVGFDVTARTFTQILASYFRCRGNKYLVQKDFFEMFRKVNTSKLSFLHLPEGAGFVQLPCPIKDQDGDEFEWFYWYIGDRDKAFCFDKYTAAEQASIEAQEMQHYGKTLRGRRVAMFAYMDKNEMIASYSLRVIPEDPSQTLKEAYRGIKMIFRGSLSTQTTHQEDEGYHPHVGLVYALLVYLASGKPDLREFRKQPEPKKQPPRLGGPSGEASNPDCVLVGFNYKKGPNYQAGKEWYVPPFPAFRWYGPGKKAVHLVTVSGSVRRRKKKPTDVREEDITGEAHPRPDVEGIRADLAGH